MRTRIELITPCVDASLRSLADVRALERPELSISHSMLQRGPSSIESEFDEALSVPDTLRKAIDAQASGAHAIVIDCMGDPGLHACREVVTIPVVGPAQTAFHCANMLGHRSAFITTTERMRAPIGRLVASYGLQDGFVSFRAVEIPVLDISKDVDAVKRALAEQAVAAVRDDHADVVILGCTGFLGCADTVRQALLASGKDVPVIDPIPLAIHFAEALIRCRLTQSRLAYPAPGGKRIEGYAFAELDARTMKPPHS